MTTQKIPVKRVTVLKCQACGGGYGETIACRSCRQVAGLPSGTHLPSWKRLVLSGLLDLLLILVTLMLGWVIWSAFTWANGQTPGMQLLGLRVIATRRALPASWLRMLAREAIVGAFLVSVLLSLGVSLIVCIVMFFDKDQRQAWDFAAGTYVIDDSGGAFRGAVEPVALVGLPSIIRARDGAFMGEAPDVAERMPSMAKRRAKQKAEAAERFAAARKRNAEFVARAPSVAPPAKAQSPRPSTWMKELYELNEAVAQSGCFGSFGILGFVVIVGFLLIVGGC